MNNFYFRMDDETANLLARHKNKSEAIRNALKVYDGYIHPDKNTSLLEVIVKQNKATQQLLEKVNDLDVVLFDLAESVRSIKARMTGEHQ